jgi:hypothetical protein
MTLQAVELWPQRFNARDGPDLIQLTIAASWLLSSRTGGA